MKRACSLNVSYCHRCQLTVPHSYHLLPSILRVITSLVTRSETFALKPASFAYNFVHISVLAYFSNENQMVKEEVRGTFRKGGKVEMEGRGDGLDKGGTKLRASLSDAMK